MEFKTIQYEQDANGVVVVTLNRPEKLNAMNSRMFWELFQALKKMGADDTVKSVLFTGAGDRAFSSGADFWGGGDLASELSLEEHAEYDELGRVFQEKFGDLYDGGLMRIVYRLDHQMFEFDKPTVSAVNGLALGVGWCFAQSCDLVYAATEAKMSYLFIRNAIGTTDLATTYTVPRTMGLHKAKELMMLGEDFTAEQAEQYGLVNKVFPAASLMAEAKKVATRFALGPTQALSQMKRVLNGQLKEELGRAIELEVQAALNCMTSTEFQNAIMARGQKQEPFPGFRET